MHPYKTQNSFSVVDEGRNLSRAHIENAALPLSGERIIWSFKDRVRTAQYTLSISVIETNY
jgi:hypothetical protein